MVNITYDRAKKNLYVYLGSTDRQPAKTVPILPGRLQLDFDATGKLIGVDFLDPSLVPPELKAEADIVDDEGDGFEDDDED